MPFVRRQRWKAWRSAQSTCTVHDSNSHEDDGHNEWAGHEAAFDPVGSRMHDVSTVRIARVITDGDRPGRTIGDWRIVRGQRLTRSRVMRHPAVEECRDAAPVPDDEIRRLQLHEEEDDPKRDGEGGDPEIASGAREDVTRRELHIRKASLLLEK